MGTRDLPELEKTRLDRSLAASAPSCKTALLRPFNSCAVYGGFVSLPLLTEQGRYRGRTRGTHFARITQINACIARLLHRGHDEAPC